MTHLEDITESRKGKHLSFMERCWIERYKNVYDYTNREIARRLKRAPQTIHTEIKDGTIQQIRRQRQNGKIYTYEREVYCAHAGQEAYERARQNSGRKMKWVEDQTFLDFADDLMLEHKWSPDAVVGRARLSDEIPEEKIPCTTTLYNWIDKGYMQTMNLDLLRKTSLKAKKHKKQRKNKKILGESIENRPTIVDTREKFGHWEIDTVVGLKSDDAALITLIERKTRFELIFKVNGREAQPVSDTLCELKERVGNHFSKVFQTITSDNGSEFSGIVETLKDSTKVFFTHPYSSWERGTNENHNGIIRRFLPKGTQMSNVMKGQIQRIQRWMNNYPRKILGYATPQEKFLEELKRLV